MTEPSKNTASDISYWHWVVDRVKTVRALSLVLIASGAAVLNTLAVLDKLGIDSTERMQFLYVTHAVVVLMLAGVVAWGKPPRYYDAFPRGSKAIRQFWQWWPFLWFCWFVLYLLLGAAEWAGISQEWYHYLASQGVNNLATLILLMCFHLLAEPTIGERLPPEGDLIPTKQVDRALALEDTQSGRPLRNEKARLFFWVSLFLAASVVEVAVVMAWKDSGQVEDVVSAFGILFGVLAATATALFVGQLDTKLMGVPLPALVVLFMFAAIQPSFEVVLNVRSSASVPPVTPTRDALEIVQAMREMIVVVALICKLVLFSIIHWLALTNRLLYYMVQNYTLHVGVAVNRSEFIENLNSPAGAESAA